MTIKIIVTIQEADNGQGTVPATLLLHGNMKIKDAKFCEAS